MTVAAVAGAALLRAAERTTEPGNAPKARGAKAGSGETEKKEAAFPGLMAGKRTKTDAAAGKEKPDSRADEATDEAGLDAAGLLVQLLALQISPLAPAQGQAAADQADGETTAAVLPANGQEEMALQLSEALLQAEAGGQAAEGTPGNAGDTADGEEEKTSYADPAAGRGASLTADVSVTGQKKTDRSAVGTSEPGGEGTQLSPSREKIAETIVRAMQSAGDGEKTGGSFRELLSREKPAAAAKKNQEISAGIGLPTENGFRAVPEDVEKSRAVEKAVGRFLDDFRSAQTGPSEIRIMLEPESLGALTISVSRTENGVSAKIRSEDKELCAIISNQLNTLVKSLENKGVTVRSVDVVFGGAEQNFSFAQSSGGRQERPPGHPFRRGGNEDGVAEADFFDQWRVSRTLTEQGGVEYRV